RARQRLARAREAAGMSREPPTGEHETVPDRQEIADALASEGLTPAAARDVARQLHQQQTEHLASKEAAKQAEGLSESLKQFADAMRSQDAMSQPPQPEAAPSQDSQASAPDQVASAPPESTPTHK